MYYLILSSFIESSDYIKAGPSLFLQVFIEPLVRHCSPVRANTSERLAARKTHVCTGDSSSNTVKQKTQGRLI